MFRDEPLYFVVKDNAILNTYRSQDDLRVALINVDLKEISVYEARKLRPILTKVVTFSANVA